MRQNISKGCTWCHGYRSWRCLGGEERGFQLPGLLVEHWRAVGAQRALLMAKWWCLIRWRWWWVGGRGRHTCVSIQIGSVLEWQHGRRPLEKSVGSFERQEVEFFPLSSVLEHLSLLLRFEMKWIPVWLCLAA